MLHQCSRHRRILAGVNLVLGIALAGAISFANAAPSSLASGGRANLNALVTANGILNRWEPVAQAAGARTASWRELFTTQLMLMSPTFLDIADSIRPGSGSAQHMPGDLEHNVVGGGVGNVVTNARTREVSA